MKQWKLFIFIFVVGVFIGVLYRLSRTQPKNFPVASLLPDLSFPEKKNTIFTLIFTGDVMLGRSVNTRILKYHDPAWPFQKIGNFLSQADITIINLESPFVQGCKPTDKGMIFCANPDSVAGLKLAGVDYTSLTNNHIQNYGEKGLNDTISLLNRNSITPLGLGKPEFLTVNGTKLALVSFNDLPAISDNEVGNQISLASSSADLVVATFHWGNEYQSEPSRRQIYLGHLAVDSGADLVVGHHPHWTQTEETYRGKLIVYSLGNLVFDQMWSEKTRHGQILKVTFSSQNLLKKEIIPIKIYDYGQPDFYPSTSD